MRRSARLSGPSTILGKEDRFRLAQELSADDFTVLRPVLDATGAVVDFTFEYANPAAGRMIGRSADDLLGGRFLDVMPPTGSTAETFRRCVRVLETGASDVIETYDASEAGSLHRAGLRGPSRGDHGSERGRQRLHLHALAAGRGIPAADAARRLVAGLA